MAESPEFLANTMADMTYVEFDDAVKRGTVGLWALGVVEEHGPHLPLGTDIYVPHEKSRRVQQRLTGLGVESIIVPPFYWGINESTGIFPGTIEVRRETMISLMVDVLSSLRRDGMRRVYCLTGHLDTAHMRTILDGVAAAASEPGGAAWFVIAPALLERIKGDPGSEHVLLIPPDPTLAGQHIGLSPRAGFIDIHAGGAETSRVLATRPDLVRRSIMATLEPTNLQFPDLVEWRKGGEVMLGLTPNGYFGDPASGTPEKGEAQLESEAALIAEAIAQHVTGGPTHELPGAAQDARPPEVAIG